MSAKTVTEVVIDGKVYRMCGYEEAEYLQKVAAYINGKITEYNQLIEFRHQPSNMRAAILELNIADDYFKAKAQIDKVEREIELKDKEIYDLKHDLISSQIKVDNLEAELAAREKEMKEIMMKNARLQASYDDIRRENSKR